MSSGGMKHIFTKDDLLTIRSMPDLIDTQAKPADNRQRSTFGRVYPRDYSVAQGGKEPFVMQTECLARITAPSPLLRISVRFLQPMARELGSLRASGKAEVVDSTPDFEVIPELRVDDQLYQTCQEAVERAVQPFPLALDSA